jgi:hypothetical protein
VPLLGTSHLPKRQFLALCSINRPTLWHRVELVVPDFVLGHSCTKKATWDVISMSHAPISCGEGYTVAWLGCSYVVMCCTLERNTCPHIFFKWSKVFPHILINKRIAQLVSRKLGKTDTTWPKRSTHKARKHHICIGIPTSTPNTPELQPSMLQQHKERSKWTPQQKENGNTTTKEWPEPREHAKKLSIVHQAAAGAFPILSLFFPCP